MFVLTDEAAGNAVAAFMRAADGSLTPAGAVPTGGNGSGGTLGSQGALVLSDEGDWLYAVNAGSNTISFFTVDDHGLHLRGQVNSG
ncbi:MAG TPA: beta-propeller fold lactonase family protein, partial [Rhodocyclaceae bacterium]